MKTFRLAMQKKKSPSSNLERTTKQKRIERERNIEFWEINYDVCRMPLHRDEGEIEDSFNLSVAQVLRLVADRKEESKKRSQREILMGKGKKGRKDLKGGWCHTEMKEREKDSSFNLVVTQAPKQGTKGKRKKEKTTSNENAATPRQKKEGKQLQLNRWPSH